MFLTFTVFLCSIKCWALPSTIIAMGKSMGRLGTYSHIGKIGFHNRPVVSDSISVVLFFVKESTINFVSHNFISYLHKFVCSAVIWGNINLFSDYIIIGKNG